MIFVKYLTMKFPTIIKPSRLLCYLLLSFFVSQHQFLPAQNLNPNRKERKKVWRKWKKNNQSYNPYLDKKAKNKPSAKLAREDKKELGRQKKAARKQMRRSRKRVNR